MMNNLSSNSLYDKILKRANIYDVIRSYGIDIHRNKCICPFHDDKHPSMSIEPNKQIFKCFSCGESGNAISFVYKYETQVNMNQEFTKRDALIKVMEICNIKDISLDNFVSKQDNSIETKQTRKIVEVNNFAQKFFQYNLNTEEGRKALDYLHSRNISDEIISELGIGYATEKDVFSNHKDVFTFEEAGLVYFNKDYKKDIFKGRITFPIYDEHGVLVGFSGRILDKSASDIKYLNTRETDVFNKSKILFNFDKAISYNKVHSKDLQLQQLYLVEGYMDVVGCKKIGIHNVVATMGTALSNEQIEMLKNSHCKINLMCDTDLPGRTAMLEDIKLLKKAGIDYSIIDLSQFFDEKDIGEISENSDKYRNHNLKVLVDSFKVSGLTFQVREYMRRNSWELLNSEQVKELVSYFKVEQMNDSEITNFIDTVKNKCMLSEKQIENIIYPDQKMKSFKEKLLHDHILNLLEKEIKSRENVILLKYFNENKNIFYSTILKIIEKNSDKLINLENGIIRIATAVNAYLRIDKNYKIYENLNRFKFPNIFKKMFVIKENEVKSISIDTKSENHLIQYFEQELKENHDKTLQEAKEVYIINSIDDLFQILPTKMIDPFAFHRIQDAMFNDEIAVFDFNHCFDEEELKKGILNMFDQSYKDENGRLKKIMLLSNINHHIDYKLKPIKKVQDTINSHSIDQKKELDADNSFYQNQKMKLDDIPETFKVLDSKTNEMIIGCTIDKVLFSKSSYHTNEYLFIRVPNSNMKYYIRADRKDITSMREGKTLFYKMDINQEFELYNASNQQIGKKINTAELLHYFDKKEKERNISQDYFVVFKSLIIKKANDGYYIKSPKDPNVAYFVPQGLVKWKDENKKSLQVFLKQNSISQYSFDPKSNKLHFEKIVNKEELKEVFKIYKVKNHKSKPDKIAISFKKSDVDLYTIDGKEIAVINIQIDGRNMQLKIPEKYISKRTTHEYFFTLNSQWKYTLSDNEYSKKVTALELNKLFSKDMSYQIKKEV